MEIKIEALQSLPPQISQLVEQSENDSYAFVRRPVDEWQLNVNRFDVAGEFLLAVWNRDQLAGVCGVNISILI